MGCGCGAAQLDVDGSGSMSFKELRLLLARMKIKLNNAQLMELWRAIDNDNSGEIMMDEFVRLIFEDSGEDEDVDEAMSNSASVPGAAPDDDAAAPDDDECPERLRRMEAVLQRRTSRFLIVLERVLDGHNQQAVIRTAEAMGIQHVW